MLERLTESANRVLNAAQEESRRLGHNLVGTEQILFGLVAESSGIAAKSLKSMGVSLRDVRNEIERLSGRNNGEPVPESIPLTSRAKKTLELSWDEAQEYGDNFVSSEHLLLGILRLGKGDALEILARLEIDVEKLRHHVIYQIGKRKAATTWTVMRGISETPTLDQFGVDLSSAEKDGQLDPVVCRDVEIERLIRILGRRDKANPLLIGERGVGKSAIVHGFVKRIQRGLVPAPLQNSRVVRLDLLYLLAHRDSTNLLKECLAEAQAGRIILVIDEIQYLFAHAAQSAQEEASFMVNWFVSHKKVTCIGMATLSEFRKLEGMHGALIRHFQTLMVNPPGIEDSIQILSAISQKLGQHHQVKISADAIEHAVKLSVQVLRETFLPDKAIDVLDEACQSVSLLNPSLISSLSTEIIRVRKEKESNLRNQQFEDAAKLRALETQLSDKLHEIRYTNELPVVEASDIEKILEQWHK